jgi:hypothetical protein
MLKNLGVRVAGRRRPTTPALAPFAALFAPWHVATAGTS